MAISSNRHLFSRASEVKAERVPAMSEAEVADEICTKGWWSGVSVVIKI